jgi:hypothetical protein
VNETPVARSKCQFLFSVEELNGIAAGLTRIELREVPSLFSMLPKLQAAIAVEIPVSSFRLMLIFTSVFCHLAFFVPQIGASLDVGNASPVSATPGDSVICNSDNEHDKVSCHQEKRKDELQSTSDVVVPVPGQVRACAFFYSCHASCGQE